MKRILVSLVSNDTTMIGNTRTMRIALLLTLAAILMTACHAERVEHRPPPGHGGGGTTPPPSGAGQGEMCGGIAGVACADGLFCRFEESARCGAGDMSGTCEPRPEACTMIYAPVCGCDGQTHGNECAAWGAGTSVAHTGECEGGGATPPAEGGAVGATCGTRGAAPCGPGLFCQHPESAACGETDMPGTCQAPPQMCTRDYRPVCGCDGQTYGNACSAHAAGVSIRSQGECGGGSSAPPSSAACVRGGCSGELCVEEGGDGIASACVFRPQFACYRSATCARQPNGQCGWTQTRELRACLANPPPAS